MSENNSELTRKEAARYLGVTVAVMENLAKRGGGPTFTRLTRRSIRYSLPELTVWRDSRKVIG